MADRYDPSFSEVFGDDRYTFRLASLGALVELEEKTAGTLGDLAARLQIGPQRGGCGAKDVFHALRLALIGGGMAAEKAYGIAERYVLGRPLVESWPLALRCVLNVVFGPAEEAEAPKKAEAAKDETSASTSAAPSRTGPSSATRRRKSGP